MVRRVVGVIVIVGLLAIGGIWRLGFGTQTAPAAAQTSPQAVPVTAGTVAAEDVPIFLHGIGTVQAYNSVAIKSRVDGQIVKIDFKEGQEVTKGEPLIEIDPRPFQAALQQAQAAKQ